MNKNLLILPAMVFTMGLASCAKTISKEDAKKFVETKYKDKTAKTLTKLTMSMDCTGSKGDEARKQANLACKSCADAYGFTYTDNSLKVSGDITSGVFFESMKIVTSKIVTTETIDAQPEGTKFVVKGSELTVNYENTEGSTTTKISGTYNGNGQPKSDESYYSFTQDNQTLATKETVSYNY